MLTTLSLNILAKDILENDYINANECPITKALARAGRPDLHDIAGLYNKADEKRLFFTDSNPSYQTLRDNVLGMYANKDPDHYGSSYPSLPIEDFSVTITFEE